MDDYTNLLNHTCAAPLRVIRKDWHMISSGVCYRLKVILKVLMWSNRSFKSSYNSSCGRRNLGGKGHSTTFFVKGELVLFTIQSRILVVFSFIAFFNSSISFLMLISKSSFALSNHSILLKPSLPSLFSGSCTTSSFLLFLIHLDEWFSSCCSRCLISWFCLVNSSILAVSIWICKANATESCGMLDSIWILKMVELRFQIEVRKSFPTDDTKLMKLIRQLICSSKQSMNQFICILARD